MANFSERTNPLLYQNIISHTLFSRGWCFCCVCEMSWRRGQTAILILKLKLFWPWQHFFLILARLLNHGSLRAQSPQSASWFSIRHLVLKWLQLTQAVCALVILLFNANLLPLFFRLFTQVHLLIDGSVEGQYITIVLFPIKNEILLNPFSVLVYSLFHLFLSSYQIY